MGDKNNLTDLPTSPSAQKSLTLPCPSVAYYAVPLHLQGAFANLGHKAGDFPVSEHVAAHCLSLPMYPYISREDQECVASTLKRF